MFINEFGDLDRERHSFALGVTAFLSGIRLSLTFSICIMVRGVLGADCKLLRVVFGRVLLTVGDLARIFERDRDLSTLRTFLERLLDLLSVGDLDLLPDGVPPLLYGVVDLLGIALGFRVSLRVWVNC